MDQSETPAETQRAEWAAESETMLAMELDHVGSCCHDSNASGPRVLSHVVFHNARVDFAIAIVKKGSPRILAMEPVVQEEIESLLIDATVHDLFI